MVQSNILVILIDDMGWRDLGCYESSFYETPNIDGLAETGMRFTDAYSACPVCSPTQASIMTGKYPARLGLTDFIGGSAKGKLLPAPYIRELPADECTLAQALHEGGYQTFHVGKWHLGPERTWPERRGFDVNVAGCDWGMPKSYFSPYDNPRLANGPDGEYLTDRLTSEAITLLETRGTEPWFMYFACYAVHIPIRVPKHYVEKYEDKSKHLGLHGKKPFDAGEHFPTIEKRVQRVKRRLFQSDSAYAGMIENLDENVGRLMQAIERIGRTKDTVVIFTSDNGGLATAEGSPTSNAPLAEGKGWMFEGGTRVPLIVNWPGHVKLGTCHEPVCSPDFYPTLLEMAGLDARPEQHVDGTSLVPLLEGDGMNDHAPLFWHYPHYGNQGGSPACAIRAGDQKLIEFYEGDHVELYNLANDIEEQVDIAKVDTDATSRMTSALHDWREAVHAKLPTQNPSFTRGWRRLFGR
jgi:arylsulfatase A-like enzyme